MNLNDFESYIDKKILTRGFDYYENGKVTSVEEIDDNVYEAEVEGTELYTVEVALDGRANITNSECDCPYDMGEYCKHQVAVFLTLRDMKSRISAGKSAAIKKKAVDIRKILSDRSKDELVDFLYNIASEYKEIKRRIELNFDSRSDEDEIYKSIALIHTYISRSSDRSGFVSYGNTYEAVEGAELVLEKVNGAVKQNRIMHALDLTLCVVHEMMDLLDDADDSDGVIGGVIERSFDLISEIINDTELSSVDKESIFKKLMGEASNRRYEGWVDWRLNLLSSCSELVDTSVLRSELENYFSLMLRDEKGDSWSSNYLTERIELIRYHVVKQYDGQKNVQEFIEQNLQYSSFRKMAIENAMKEKDYDYVIKLTLDGEEQDKNLIGLVKQWKEYRYKVFKLSGKLEEQREISVNFILAGSYEYYKELKNTYDSKEWVSVYPKILYLLEGQKKTYQDVYTRILIDEGEKHKLLEYVKQSPSSIEQFYRNLVPEFKDEVYVLFRKYIELSAANANSRKGYKQVCDIIRNLKKAGGKEQALEIKEILIAKYAKKPAFKDELSKV